MASNASNSPEQSENDSTAQADAAQSGTTQASAAAGESTKASEDTHYQNWLRAQADLENYRKRVQKEMAEDRLYSSLPLVRDLLPALDNLHRAVEAAAQATDAKKLTEGVKMVLKQFDDILGKHGIQPMDAVGKPFDPHLHQALQQVPTTDKPPMTVLAEYERGYTLRDRVVRPSTVIVSAPPAEAPAEASQPG